MMKIISVSLAVILAILVALFIGVDYWVSHTKSLNTATQVFTINSAEDEGGGDRFKDIARKLEEKDLIISQYIYYYYAWRNNLQGQFLAGNYEIEPSSTLAEMSNKFTKGSVIIEKREEIKVTFNEGLTLTEYAEILNENNLPGENFLEISLDPRETYYDEYTFLKPGESLEGYLYPDTYNVFPDTDATAIIKKMLNNFEQKVGQSLINQMSADPRGIHGIVILASVVEGEVNKDSDRGLVAGLFQNRLDIDMPLQSDATLDYITGVAEVKHTLDDLEIDSPYNTYKYPGLPAGPINNPSIESIIAAANPQETDYLFFLNSNKEENLGETFFAETYDQHLIYKAQNGL